MSEFEAVVIGVEGLTSSASAGRYELTGPPKVLPGVALMLLVCAVVITLILGDSVLAFAFGVTSSLVTLSSRVVNQIRINQPSYSSAKWFSWCTASLYVVASCVSVVQVLMVAYGAGR